MWSNLVKHKHQSPQPSRDKHYYLSMSSSVTTQSTLVFICFSISFVSNAPVIYVSLSPKGGICKARSRQKAKMLIRKNIGANAGMSMLGARSPFRERELPISLVTRRPCWGIEVGSSVDGTTLFSSQCHWQYDLSVIISVICKSKMLTLVSAMLCI